MDGGVMSNYFVMLEHPRGIPVPMTTGEYGEDIAWFELLDDAKEAAKNNPLGDAYGYEIFERGGGV